MRAGAVSSEDAGDVRYTCRVRLSRTARCALEADWARCRWIWNECVARSRKAHAAGEKAGPAALDRMLTEGPAHDPLAGRRVECSSAAGRTRFRQVPREGTEGHQGPGAAPPPGGYAALE
jgi:hypothetical protein